MPADISKLNQDKDKIISFISQKGPSLPIHIARAANLSVLFASAFLSELYAEGRVRMSHMKVGSSSLYLLPGQESQLENFIEYLNPKEKEAYQILKENKILADEEQVPAIRVALRAIKDFAIPIKVKLQEQQKVFWKFFLISNDELSSLIENKEEINKDSKNQEIKKEQTSIAQVNLEKDNNEGQKREVPKIQPDKEESQDKNRENKEIKQEKPLETIKKERKSPKTENSNFTKTIKDYFSKKDVEIMTIMLEKRKEFWAIIRANSTFGKQEYYVIAKDKRKISDQEIDQALERSQSEKMPVLIIAPGELDKKAAMRILSLRNLIKFINLLN
jgi:hypothetical protein